MLAVINRRTMKQPSPMTLGNMRENGVRSLLVTCSNVTCRHEKIVNVDAYGDDCPHSAQGCGVSGAASAARMFGQIGMSTRRRACLECLNSSLKSSAVGESRKNLSPLL